MTLESLWWWESAAAPPVRRATDAIGSAQRGLLVAGRFGWDSPMAAQAYRSALADVHGGLQVALARLDEALAAVIQHDRAVVDVRAARRSTVGGVLSSASVGAWQRSFGGVVGGPR